MNTSHCTIACMSVGGVAVMYVFHVVVDHFNKTLTPF